MVDLIQILRKLWTVIFTSKLQQFNDRKTWVGKSITADIKTCDFA